MNIKQSQSTTSPKLTCTLKNYVGDKTAFQSKQKIHFRIGIFITSKMIEVMILKNIFAKKIGRRIDNFKCCHFMSKKLSCHWFPRKLPIFSEN
jgi:hypothetical protein